MNQRIKFIAAEDISFNLGKKKNLYYLIRIDRIPIVAYKNVI